MGRLIRRDARLTSVSRSAGNRLNLTAVGGAERPVRDPVRLRSLRAGSRSAGRFCLRSVGCGSRTPQGHGELRPCGLPGGRGRLEGVTCLVTAAKGWPESDRVSEFPALEPGLP